MLGSKKDFEPSLFARAPIMLDIPETIWYNKEKNKGDKHMTIIQAIEIALLLVWLPLPLRITLTKGKPLNRLRRQSWVYQRLWKWQGNESLYLGNWYTSSTMDKCLIPTSSHFTATSFLEMKMKFFKKCLTNGESHDIIKVQKGRARHHQEWGAHERVSPLLPMIRPQGSRVSGYKCEPVPQRLK